MKIKLCSLLLGDLPYIVAAKTEERYITWSLSDWFFTCIRLAALPAHVFFSFLSFQPIRKEGLKKRYWKQILCARYTNAKECLDWKKTTPFLPLLYSHFIQIRNTIFRAIRIFFVFFIKRQTLKLRVTFSSHNFKYFIFWFLSPSAQFCYVKDVQR